MKSGRSRFTSSPSAGAGPQPRGRDHDEPIPEAGADDPLDAPERGTPESGDAPIGEAETTPGKSAVSPPPANPSDEINELRDRWLRAEAELQNFRRRATRELEDSRRAAEESALLELIEFLDDLDRAVEAARSADAEAAWMQGVELVAQRMRDHLARAGVIPIDAMGHHFDPRQHEALMEMDAPGADPGTVVAVVRKGYRRGDRVLRPARVAVAGETATS